MPLLSSMREREWAVTIVELNCSIIVENNIFLLFPLLPLIWERADALENEYMLRNMHLCKIQKTIDALTGALIARSAVDKIEQVIGYVSTGFSFGYSFSVVLAMAVVASAFGFDVTKLLQCAMGSVFFGN